MRQAFSLTLIFALLICAFPVFAQEATQPAVSPRAFYRFANFAPDMSLAFTMDNEPVAGSELAYKSISDWTSIPVGHASLTVSSGDASTSAEPLEVDFADNRWYTIVGVGTTGSTPHIEIIDESYNELLPGTAGITLVNAVQGESNLDFVRDESTYTADLFPLGNEANMGSWLSLIDDFGTFDFRAVETGHPDNVLVDAPATELRENERYLVAAVGTANLDDEHDVELVIDATPMSEILLVRGDMASPGTIIEAAEAHPDLAVWLEAVEQAGLTDMLRGDGPFTVFIPVAFTFDDLPASVRDNPEALANFLRGYMVDGEFRSQDIFKGGTLTTLGGDTLTLEERGENGFVNEAQVIDVNIPATNGVIHIVSGFVVPAGEASP